MTGRNAAEAGAVPKACNVVVVGAGGNIGSHLVPHLARLPMVSAVFLVDSETYEEKNLTTQDITASDVGQEKVEVQARRLLRIRPELRVTTAAQPVETLPLGSLRGDVLLGCVDSRRARQVLNEVAWALGMPWIDAGVLADQKLGRVSRYAPACDTACLECNWSARDYELVEQSYPCEAVPAGAAPTNAPSGLGALAAALQALECEWVLGLSKDAHGPAHELVVDAAHHHLYSTKLIKNAACLFEHRRPDIRPLAIDAGCVTVSDLLEAHRAETGSSHPPRSLRVFGQVFAGELVCANGCAQPAQSPYVLSRMLHERRKCAACGGALHTPGFSIRRAIATDRYGSASGRVLLREFGIRQHDVLSLEDEAGRTVHFEILGRARDCKASSGACGTVLQRLTQGCPL